MRQVIDCIVFNDEVELLEARMYELYDVVDMFIVCESGQYFTGGSKESNFEAHYQRYASYSDKIIRITCPNIEVVESPWVRERAQRDFIAQALRQLPLSSCDLVILSDADEIPRRSVIENIRLDRILIDRFSAVDLRLSLYYYSFNWTTDRFLNVSKVFRYEQILAGKKMSEFHRSEGTFIINDAGWHMSYFGGIERILGKLSSFSETQDNTEQNRRVDYLADCIEKGVLFFSGEKLASNDKNDIPSLFTEESDRFREFCYHPQVINTISDTDGGSE